MKNITLLSLLIISFFSFNTQLNAACIWKSKIAKFTTWDSCANNKSSLNGSLSLNVKGCFVYKWTVGGATVGTNSTAINYKITKNGTYILCLKITDTCNQCDTTLCATFTISCLKTCNWKSRFPYFYAWDTCKGTGGSNSLNAYISFNSTPNCFKYAWTVNGSAAGKNKSIFNYAITKNGTYSVCLKVTDTCNNCDTTFCSTKTITCFPNPCTWKKSTKMNYNNTCGSTDDTLTAYTSSSGLSCAKYAWSLNGNLISTNAAFQRYLITANGSYKLCVKITDTCNKCDTTICQNFTVSCISSQCNWKSKLKTFYAWDTCKGKGGSNSLNAYVTFNTTGCFKYQWTVDKALAGNSNIMNYKISANGTYNVCVKITDTCNKCDTTICSTGTITCFSSTTCNWKNRTPTFTVWDTCKGSGGANSVNAYISFKSFYCLKYVWTVNGVPQSTKNSILNYKVLANGTYVICVKAIDSCNNCDTTFCSTRTISCFTNNKCNWKSSNPNFTAWDTCKGTGGRNSINANISFTNKTCLKYAWSVNGVARGGNGNIFGYPVNANGTYTICVKVTDTCNKCDTTFCSTRTISCFKAACNFKARGPYFTTWDTCSGNKSTFSGYINFNNRSCLKYAWTLAGVAAGNNQSFTAPVYKNGTYVICVKVSDTCSSSRCDTTFCYTRTINCNGLGIRENLRSTEDISVYPNPAKNIFYVEWSGNTTRFEVINILGNLVYKGELGTGKNTIQTDAWANGVYMIRVETGNGTRTLKIVVNR